MSQRVWANGSSGKDRFSESSYTQSRARAPIGESQNLHLELSLSHISTPLKKTLIHYKRYGCKEEGIMRRFIAASFIVLGIFAHGAALARSQSRTIHRPDQSVRQVQFELKRLGARPDSHRDGQLLHGSRLRRPL
jgi:hypothetical protein